MAALAFLAGAAGAYLLYGRGGASARDLRPHALALVPDGAEVESVELNEGAPLVVGEPFAVVRYAGAPGAAPVVEALGASGWSIVDESDRRGGTRVVARKGDLEASVAALVSGTGSIRVSEREPGVTGRLAFALGLGALGAALAGAAFWYLARRTARGSGDQRGGSGT